MIKLDVESDTRALVAHQFISEKQILLTIQGRENANVVNVCK